MGSVNYYVKFRTLYLHPKDRALYSHLYLSQNLYSLIYKHVLYTYFLPDVAPGPGNEVTETTVGDL